MISDNFGYPLQGSIENRYKKSIIQMTVKYQIYILLQVNDTEAFPITTKKQLPIDIN
jgi:hypothetical protein